MSIYTREQQKKAIQNGTNAKRKGINQLNFPANPLILLVRPTGFEPVTYGLEVRCSIQLSYGRKSLPYGSLSPRSKVQSPRFLEFPFGL
jgi:hypothetical protein